MSTIQSNEPVGTDEAAEIESTAMSSQLRKDVASWSVTRSEESSNRAIELNVAVAKPTAPPRVRRVKSVVAEAKPADTRKKPFGMSYDGTSQADYITYMIARAAR